jgi:hypothetical protein
MGSRSLPWERNIAVSWFAMMKSKQFVPFLSGISATDPTFSRDGRWVAYVSYPDHILWRSRGDGSEGMLALNHGFDGVTDAAVGLDSFISQIIESA